MGKPLVIVESPTKVKTINKILGGKYNVVSSMGHLIDLPKSSLGVDVDKDFEPNFIVVRSKQKVLTQLKKEAEEADEIYLATDPDREGEAIGWNIAQHIGDTKKFYRVSFQEITKEAVLRAFEHPRAFDNKKINAQVARRVLDRIVGYKLSPVLWSKVGSRLSAGRVQSVALRIIVERERAILKFVPQEYWEIHVDLKKEKSKGALTAVLEKVDNEKCELKNQIEANDIADQLKKEKFVVSSVTQKEVKRKPNAPFITSTLQQDAFNKLGFNANKTMMIAQELYEGVELGDEEAVGLITYMRTDSVAVSQEAMGKLRKFITDTYGKDYLPGEPNEYKSKKSAQEAHEAIRPSDVSRKPSDIRKFLSPDQAKLYELIWNRFVGSQMNPAVYQQTKIIIQAGKFQLGVAGSNLIFEGYLSVFKEAEEEQVKADLSQFKEGDKLELVDIKPSQHFTKPPARFSDASLVKALEEEGIGRPSTYASIIQTLVFRNYIVRERGYFTPTELGIHICDLLVEYFKKVMDVGFTAHMEENLDLVEEGDLNYADLLKEFYAPFKEELEYAMQHIVKTENFVDKQCPQCGKQMVIKWGRRGKFLSCSGFPKCKFAQPFTLGIKCPQEGCLGELVERRSRRGKFYGCSNYPQCTYISNELPSPSPS